MLYSEMQPKDAAVSSSKSPHITKVDFDKLNEWWLVQGATLPWPYDSWEKLQAHSPAQQAGTENEWVYDRMNEYWHLLEIKWQKKN